MTKPDGPRISRQVIKLRPLFTLLVLAVWITSSCPWAGPLAVLAHERHEVSLNWAHGHLHVVLEHADDAPHALSGNAILAVTHAGHHADHVLHPFAPDQFLRATSTGPSAPDTFYNFAPGCSSSPAIAEPRGVRWRAHAPPRSSPALDSLRTTVLVV